MAKGKVPMTKTAAARIQSDAAKNPGINSAKAQFAQRAQGAADKNVAAGKAGKK